MKKNLLELMLNNYQVNPSLIAPENWKKGKKVEKMLSVLIVGIVTLVLYYLTYHLLIAYLYSHEHWLVALVIISGICSFYLSIYGPKYCEKIDFEEESGKPIRFIDYL